MFYLKDEYTDLIIGDSIKEDTLYMMADADKEKAKGKDSSGEETFEEEG